MKTNFETTLLHAFSYLRETDNYLNATFADREWEGNTHLAE